MIRTYQHWINGREHGGTTGEPHTRHSPAHGEVLARFAAGTAADVDAAVTVARRVFEDASTWATLPGSRKAALLNAWAALIERDVTRLAEIEAEEVGKPIRYARGEIEWSVELLRYAASLAWQLEGRAMTQLGDDKLGLVTREPRGVVGIVVPWNYPMVTLFQKLPYALAAGCTVVIKPSELTSGTALEVTVLAKEAGIPDGVINVVTGLGETVGEALSTHPGVDMLSFTGSTRVGKRIARNAADSLKRVSLELGGKSANIVFADADIDSALDGALFGVVLNQGEECISPARLLVEKPIAETFVKQLVERARKVAVGMPLDEKSDVGAMIHEAHMERVLELIASGSKEGARLELGGSRVTTAGLDRGFFVPVTIFSGVDPAMRIFREEIFGPVLAVTTFETVEEAIQLANDTSYGLANGLWTKDVDKALKVSRRLRSGTVFVNTYFESAPQMPFGGYKESGLGRENGLEGLLEFTEVKSTLLKLGTRDAALPLATSVT